MPSISLVVCLHKERDYLRRLLSETADCFDELVVIHDGPETQQETEQDPKLSPPAIDFAELSTSAPVPKEYVPGGSSSPPGSIGEIVRARGGRYFEGPRCFQQEPHWPFAWWYAHHDWILRLDADEFPSRELREWLIRFRKAPSESILASGYTCIWPLWTGHRSLSLRWPDDRIFMVNKRKVHFPAMVEQVPIPDEPFLRLPLVLHHQPSRKAFGVRSFLLRPQAYRWRRVIAESLLKDATMLPRWRWGNPTWPLGWEQLRANPLKTAFRRLLSFPLNTARTLLQYRLYGCLYSVPFAGMHHFLIGCLLFLAERRKRSS
jgi:hypothetical protein